MTVPGRLYYPSYYGASGSWGWAQDRGNKGRYNWESDMHSWKDRRAVQQGFDDLGWSVEQAGRDVSNAIDRQTRQLQWEAWQARQAETRREAAAEKSLREARLRHSMDETARSIGEMSDLERKVWLEWAEKRQAEQKAKDKAEGTEGLSWQEKMAKKYPRTYAQTPEQKEAARRAENHRIKMEAIAARKAKERARAERYREREKTKKAQQDWIQATKRKIAEDLAAQNKP